MTTKVSPGNTQPRSFVARLVDDLEAIIGRIDDMLNTSTITRWVNNNDDSCQAIQPICPELGDEDPSSITVILGTTRKRS